MYISFLCLLSHEVFSQTSYVVIQNIEITGLKRTRVFVVKQELDIRTGDTLLLEELASRININEQRLKSINIFSNADINIKNWNTEKNTCDLVVDLKENWFIYPYIIFGLADRNFDVWRKEMNFALDRLNYGIAVSHINLSGNKDKLKLRYQRGYTRKYEFSYEYPYLKNNLGIAANFLYSNNRELAFRSLGNKLLFFSAEDEREIFYQYKAGLSINHRTSPMLFQALKFEYINASADTAVTQRLNPQYFGSGRANLNYLAVAYSITYDKTIFPLYPLGGYRLEATIRKEGISGSRVNNAFLTGAAEIHFPLGKRFFTSHRLKSRIQLMPNALTYFQNAAIGYKEDIMTGYQLYVIDGRNFILQKNTLKFMAWDTDIKTVSFMPEQLKEINIKIFIRTSLDFAYAYDPEHGEGNPYSNRLEYGYGPGIDIILFNNFAFSAEYGITRLGESGFFYNAGFVF